MVPAAAHEQVSTAPCCCVTSLIASIVHPLLNIIPCTAWLCARVGLLARALVCVSQFTADLDITWFKQAAAHAYRALSIRYMLSRVHSTIGKHVVASKLHLSCRCSQHWKSSPHESVSLIHNVSISQPSTERPKKPFLNCKSTSTRNKMLLQSWRMSLQELLRLVHSIQHVTCADILQTKSLRQVNSENIHKLNTRS